MTQLTLQQLSPAVKLLVETIRNETEAGKERAYLAMKLKKAPNFSVRGFVV